MTDNSIHKTNRNAKTARAAQETSCAAIERRSRNPRNCSTSRLICQLCRPLERCLQKRWPKGIRQQTAASPAMQAFRKAACQIAETAFKRRQSQWLQNRAMDAKGDSSDNSQTFRRLLPTFRHLVHSFWSELELPKAREAGQRTQRAGHRNLAKETLALYKKTREKAVKPSFCWMKTALCSPLWYVEPGPVLARSSSGKIFFCFVRDSLPIGKPIFIPYEKALTLICSRRPSGTARSNCNHAFKTNRSHAACSVIIASSLALAPLAQPCE